jgi:hypothetical protein
MRHRVSQLTLIATNQQQLAQHPMMSAADAMHQTTMMQCCSSSSISHQHTFSSAPSAHFLCATWVPLLCHAWDDLFSKLKYKQEGQIGTGRAVKDVKLDTTSQS